MAHTYFHLQVGPCSHYNRCECLHPPPCPRAGRGSAPSMAEPLSLLSSSSCWLSSCVLCKCHWGTRHAFWALCLPWAAVCEQLPSQTPLCFSLVCCFSSPLLFHAYVHGRACPIGGSILRLCCCFGCCCYDDDWMDVSETCSAVLSLAPPPHCPRFWYD